MGQHGSSLTQALQDFLTQFGFNPSVAPGAFPVFDDRFLPVIEVGSFLAAARRPWEAVAVERTFWGWIDVAAVAAEFSQGQLFTPAGSGRRVYVTRVSFAQSANIPGLVYANTALTTAVATVASKENGAAAPGASLLQDSIGAVADAPVFYRQQTIDGASGNTGFVNLWDAPIQLDPGQGLAFQGSGVTQDFDCSFEWSEIDI